MTRRSYDQACPVANALDVVGERWTLLIVRDLVFGPLRFSELRDGLPGLAPNLLSERLRFLVGTGLVSREAAAPPARRVVYRLTSEGRRLGPVVHELARFGIAGWADPDVEPPPPRLVRGAVLSLLVPEALDDAAWHARLHLGAATVDLVVGERLDDGGRDLDRLRVRDVDGPPADDTAEVDVELDASLGTLLALRRHELTPAEARRAGRLRILGDDGAATRLGALLGWPGSTRPARSAPTGAPR